jgi:hypothetical protein
LQNVRCNADMTFRQLIFIILFPVVNISGQDSFDYESLNSKKILIYYAIQKYDSTSQFSIDSRITSISIDESTKLLKKADIKVLSRLITDTTLHSNQKPEEFVKTFYAPRVFVIYDGQDMIARILVGCNGKVIAFDPPRRQINFYRDSDFVLNEKGILVMDKLVQSLGIK